MGDILKTLKAIEASIYKLQECKDQEGGLMEGDLASLRGKLSMHHLF